MDLDGCNNRKCYVGVHGTEFKFGMPVKPTTNPLEVEPSLDGSDAIGLVICNKISIPSNDSVTVIRTGRSLCWTDIAANIGKDPASMDDWWEFHIAMAKLNIYVEFN